MPAPIGASGLKDLPGWLPNTNGDPRDDQDCVIRSVVGTGFDQMVFYHDSAGAIAPTGWYVGDTENENWPLDVGKGYVVFVKGPSPVVWRQSPP